jgi:hypothetical protein
MTECDCCYKQIENDDYYSCCACGMHLCKDCCQVNEYGDNLCKYCYEEDYVESEL